jgi:hypothetical protein
MATSHNLYTLSNATATRLTPTGMHSGMDITLQNISDTAYVYVGGEGVTALSYGYRIAPGHAISWELPERDELYAISDTDSSKLAVLKTSLEK